MKRVNRRPGQRRVYSLDNLPMPRCFMRGPRWQKHFEVEQQPIAELVPPEQISWHRLGRKVLVFSFEADIRERIQEELRPGVFAEWSDPYEQFGIPRPSTKRKRVA